MNRTEFSENLKKRLAGLPQADLEERVSFYDEMICDRMEDGMTEEEAVASVGSIESIAAQVTSEIPLTRLVRARVKPKKKPNGWVIALLILGFPLWFSLLIAAFAILVSLLITVWAVIISLFAVDFALAVCAVAMPFAMFGFFSAGNPAGAFFALGAGCICAGLAIPFFFGCVWIARAVLRLTGKMILGIKASFVGKEDS
ncbi:MAG: DUF1700 domain-containing protein [Lachnospiraceae bacterium]|nr:DUF1700 domain-containing protein [Lachnospiraceae bacterium]